MKHTFLHAVCLLACTALFPLLSSAKTPDAIGKKQSSVCFIENKGQVTDQFGKNRNDIDFRLNGAAINAFISSGRIQYQWTKDASPVTPLLDKKANKNEIRQEIYHMDMVLVGADLSAPVHTAETHEYFERYYLGQCEAGTVAHTFGKITYSNVYPGIDWVLYADAKSGRLKYDFIVRPGASVQDIQVRYNGADAMQLQGGNINITNPFGSITEQAPYSYNAETKGPVASSFSLQNNTLGFNVGEHSGTLVIDPNIEWGTYFGGPNNETGYTVATDTAGAAYMGGYTTSSTNIAISTLNNTPYSTLYTANNDAYAVKFDKNCVPIWATYYGGSGNDNFFACTVDTIGSIYFAGNTGSSSGIAFNGAQGTYGGGIDDAFLVKFAPNGTRIWATYYGGSGNESSLQLEYMVWVAVDKFNDVYLCGNTTSPNNMTFGPSIYQSQLNRGNTNGLADGYIAKFNTGGSRIWGTYFGDTAVDWITKIAPDPSSGNIYIAGVTQSSRNIATAGTQQTSQVIPLGKDGFLAKFSNAGAMQWGTYFGADGDEIVEGLAVDQLGNIYMAGSTAGATSTYANRIASPGCYQPLPGSSDKADVFLTRFNSNGLRVWGTFWGTANIDHCGDMAIDASGNVCFTGFTASSSGIATVGAYQTTFGGGFDAYLAVFTISGIRYFASYMGGSKYDYGYGLKYSKSGDLYLSGTTQSTNNIAYGSVAYASVISGVIPPDPLSPNPDAFLLKFKADTSTFILQPFPYSVMCAGDTMAVDYGVTAPFKPGNVFKLELSDVNGNFPSTGPGNIIGTLTSSTSGIIKGVIPINTPGSTKYRVRIQSTLPIAQTLIDNQNDINIKLLPVKPTILSNTPVCSGTSINLSATTLTPGISYSWSGPQSFTSTAAAPVVTGVDVSNSGAYVLTISLNGCSTSDTENVLVNITPVVPNVGSNSPVCSGSTLSLTSSTSTPGVAYSWTGPGFTVPSTQQNPSIPGVSVTASGYYVVTVKLTGCSSKDSVLVAVNPTYTPKVIIQAIPDTSICIGDTISFVATGTGGGATPNYQWVKNNVLIPNATQDTYGSKTMNDGDMIRCIFSTTGSCLTKNSDTSVPIKVNISPMVKPKVTISYLPDINGLGVGVSVLFSAAVTDGGSSPTYQWSVNGTDISGAISLFWAGVAGTDIKTGDRVCVKVKSNFACANPDTASNCSPEVKISTGIDDGKGIGANGLRLYPNPNNGNFHLSGIVNSSNAVEIEIVNSVGQVLSTEKILPLNHQLDKTYSLHLPAGVYLVKFKTGTSTQTMRFSVVD